MEAKTQFLCAMVIFLGLLSQGSCQCTLDNVRIIQDANSRFPIPRQKWNVTISNLCACTQQDLKLDCSGFRPFVKPDPKYVTIVGTWCVISDQGQPIRPFSSINFAYTWDSGFAFIPISTQFNCS